MNIGFIGAGKMAEAMIRALLKSGVATPQTICASDVDAARRLSLGKEVGILLHTDNAVVAKCSEIIFLSVKPQQLDTVLKELNPAIGHHHLVISIAAGKPIAVIEALIPQARVVRVMPNVACLVSEAMSTYTMGHNTTPNDRDVIVSILKCFGKACELPESLFDVVTALCGSGPAFFAYILNGLVKGAEAEGLPRKEALFLAEQTMFGTARLLLETSLSPQELIDSVTSARGTTAEGRAILESSEINTILCKTISAATKRSRELRAI